MQARWTGCEHSRLGLGVGCFISLVICRNICNDYGYTTILYFTTILGKHFLIQDEPLS
jgi:hypothetical protein